MVDAGSATSAASLFRGGRLLERERELASLAALVKEVAAGTPGVVIIEGPAGIGKTQLVKAARRYGEEAAFGVLSGRGSELERAFPFGLVRQLFEPELVEDRVRKRLLGGSAAAASVVFDTGEEGFSSEQSGDASFAILHGLFWLALNLAGERPLLLAVDDLHWCDRSSLRYLGYLIRRLEGLRVLVVCSLRPLEPAVDVALIGELASDPLTVSLNPRPLSATAVAELVGTRLGGGASEGFSAACTTATGGNPLLLSELLKALDAEGIRPDSDHVDVVTELGPNAASRAVLLRLARLSAEAVAVAHSAAVLGEGADVSALAALAGLDEETAAGATAALVRAEILRSEQPIRFEGFPFMATVREGCSRRSATYTRAEAFGSTPVGPRTVVRRARVVRCDEFRSHRRSYFQRHD